MSLSTDEMLAEHLKKTYDSLESQGQKLHAAEGDVRLLRLRREEDASRIADLTSRLERLERIQKMDAERNR